MTNKDASYYAEQINSGTTFRAESRGGELIVREADNRVIARTRDEYEANLIYNRLMNESLREAAGDA